MASMTFPLKSPPERRAFLLRPGIRTFYALSLEIFVAMCYNALSNCIVEEHGDEHHPKRTQISVGNGAV